MRALLVAVLAAGLGACFTPVEGGDCRSDSDCGGSVCTRVGECSSQPYSLRVRWTVRGEPASAPGACAAISELELSITDPTLAEQYAVRPVPCAAGSFFFDKLPLGFTDVGVTAFSSRGDFLDREWGTANGIDDVTVDLQF